MNFLTALFVIGFLVSGAVGGMSFIPNEDIMTYGADGELKTIWGEHNFYTDTSSMDLNLWMKNGTICIGANYAR